MNTVTKEKSLGSLLVDKEPEVEIQHYVAKRLEEKAPNCKVLWERTSPLNHHRPIRVDLAVISPTGKLRFVIEIKRIGQRVETVQQAKYDELTTLHGILPVIKIEDGDYAQADLWVDWIVANLHKSLGKLQAPLFHGTDLFNYDWSDMRHMEIMSSLDRQLIIEHNQLGDNRPYHPAHLTALILTGIIEDKKRIATDRFEIVRQLQAYYGNSSDVTFIDSAVTESLRKVNKERADKFNIPYFTMEDATQMNKFDLVIANPPYSSGPKMAPIYPKFFEKALEISDLLVIVMPFDETKAIRYIGTKFKFKVNLHSIREPIAASEYFPTVSQEHIKVIFASIHHKNPGVVLPPPKVRIDTLKGVAGILPERNRLSPIIGGINGTEPILANGIEYINAMTKMRGVEKRRIALEYIRKEERRLASISDAPWFVLISENISINGFYTTIIQRGVVWGRWCRGFACASEEEAKQREAWIKSGTILDEVNRLNKLAAVGKQRGADRVSKKVLSLLPDYK
jgi:Eco57I restriction-modification methylase